MQFVDPIFLSISPYFVFNRYVPVCLTFTGLKTAVETAVNRGLEESLIPGEVVPGIQSSGSFRWKRGFCLHCHWSRHGSKCINPYLLIHSVLQKELSHCG